MLFNSYEFIFLFLPLVIAGFHILAKWRYCKGALLFLTVSSLAFYGYWNLRYLVLFIFTVLFNFFIGRQIEKSQNKNILYIGIGANLLLLGYYKYTGFVISNLNGIFELLLPVPEIILPLGISFFTFTQIAYLIDIYRAESKNYSFLEYSLFVSFFPHLIAGPILYHKDIIPQFGRLRTFVFSNRNFSMGLAMFSMGLFKKVIIADSLIEWVAPVFARPGDASFIEAWIGAIGYTFQLYYDFSGYSDMAIGLGWMLNIHLPVNFNSPFRATSMVILWNRWHITLVTFLNNYLFFPLGGIRGGYWKTMRNIMIIMIVAGIWHGANWNYVLWGVFNGLLLVINHSWRRWGFALPLPLAWLLTFTATVTGMMLTRASNVADAVTVFKTMFGAGGIVIPPLQQPSLVYDTLSWFIGFGDWKVLDATRSDMVMTLGALLLSIHIIPNTNQLMRRFEPGPTWAVFTAILLGISILRLNKVTEFLYFQF